MSSDSPAAVLFDIHGNSIDTSHIVVSANNSTTVPLAANATFVGIADDLTPYQEVDVNIAGAPSIAPGTLYFEFSPDGTHWDVSIPFALAGPSMVPLPLRVVLPFFRVRYVNGNTALTELRLTIVFHRTGAKHLTRFLNQSIDITEPVENVRAFIGGQRPDGLFGNVPVSKDNFLRISLDDVGPTGEDRLFAADKTVFGSGVTVPRISQIITDFTKSLDSSDVQSTLTGTGLITQGNGIATIATGTGATASASAVTNKSILYSPGREIYTQFTVAFTIPTDVNSEQRSGLFDGYNGMFVGYHGTTLGVTIRNNSVDTFIPRSSFNGDLLDGNPISRFTRGQVPEPINPALVNLYRIRFGWLGAAPVIFQIMAPDGQWVDFHTIRQPNSSTLPSIASPSLPITCEVIKTGSNATNLQIITSSWDAGTVEDPIVFGTEDLRSHKYVTTQLASQNTSQTLRTNSVGRLFKCTSIILFASNTSNSNDGLLEVMDGGPSGTILLPISLTSSTNQFGSQVSMVLTFPTPLRFFTDTYLKIVSGIITYSVTVVGYEVSL